MKCQQCGQPASVQVTEIPAPIEGEDSAVVESYLCDPCATELGLPSASPKPSTEGSQIWKLLEVSARKARQQAGLTCKSCGLTLAEFRSKGRLGCAACYQVFWQHLEPLLLRVHNATEHNGRGPGTDDAVLAREDAIGQLKVQLQNAIRDEAYESAAKLRDELQSLESSGGSATPDAE